MEKIITYTYLGTNGVLTTPINLEGIYKVKNYVLKADQGMFLTKDGKELVKQVSVPEEDLPFWREISGQV